MSQPSDPSISNPGLIRDVEHLEDLLSEPTPSVIETIRKTDGDFIVLGVGGKMGPTLARMIRRAVNAVGDGRRVIGVSRFTTADLQDRLASQGVEPLWCDLLDPKALRKLPEVPNVIYMAGMKFGTTGNESRTWAMNTFLPGMVVQKYRASRIVAFSTGNVYPMATDSTLGCTEETPPMPSGEYAMSCLGRERIFEHFSRTLNIPMAMIRLNYAVEMRYGVLVDLAQRIWRGEPVDVSIGYVNVIWQADANAMAIRALELVSTPPCILNVTGMEKLSVRSLSEQLGQLLGKTPILVGNESGRSLLNNAAKCNQLFGSPRFSPAEILKWTADWVRRGGPTLGKPTHYEATDGKY